MKSDRPIPVIVPPRDWSVCWIVDEQSLSLDMEEIGPVGGGQILEGQDLVGRA